MSKRAANNSAKHASHAPGKMDRHIRIARASLQDLAVFYHALQDEIARQRECERAGAPVDSALYEQMGRASEAYQHAMYSFTDFNSNRTSNALIAFADVVQDMIAMIHFRRRNA